MKINKRRIVKWMIWVCAGIVAYAIGRNLEAWDTALRKVLLRSMKRKEP